MNVSQKILMSGFALTMLGAHAEGLYTYALIDGGLANTTITGGTGSKTEFVTGGYAPTFAGLTYEKAMNGGLTVGAKLEQGFSITPADGTNSRYAFGNGDFLNREANLYIKSSAGTFVVGTQPNIAFKTVLIGEPRAGSNFGSALAMIDIAGGLGTVDDAALSYTSPAMGGFTLSAQYVPETKSKLACDTCYGVKSGNRASLSYSAGNLNVGVATYSSDTLTSTTTTDSQRTSGSIISGSYKVGAITFKGIMASQKANAAYISKPLKTTGVGGAYAWSDKTTFDFGTYKSTSDAGGLSVTTVGLGAQHKLTKELTLYGQQASVKNSSTTGIAFFNFAGPMVTDNVLTTGKTANTTNIGLLYGFF